MLYAESDGITTGTVSVILLINEVCLMKKLLIAFFMFFIIGFLDHPVTVHADMGPKPSVNVRFKNVGDRTVYATLYALRGGPSPVSFGDGNHVQRKIWDIFDEYSKTEEAAFVRDIWIINKNDTILNCEYMPPRKYKLVIYISEEDRLLESDFYTKELFEEIYVVDLDKVQDDGKLILKRDPNIWIKTIFMVLLRFVITLAIEFGIAFIFGISGKRSFAVLLAANVATQVFLNIFILSWKFTTGVGWGELMLLFILEVIVFIAEAKVYSIFLKKTNDPPVGRFRAVAYAFFANAASYLAGTFLL